MAGIYLHIPFCKQKCCYCDFHFSTTFHGYREEMIAALAEELHLRAIELKGQRINTVYFGGGTPSLLKPEELLMLMDGINACYELDLEAEITLEANPDDVTEANLLSWKNAGINRLSIGIQSFKEEDLRWMNRAHSSQEAANCVSLAQSHGFINLSVDLIYGSPDLSREEWAGHVQCAIDMKVPHISAYCLTIEDRTALHNRVKKGQLKLPSEDVQSEQFLLLLEMLTNNNYDQYEISNFAMAGFESRHNSAYWRGVKYIGIGPSAHSFDGKSRRWNIANNQLYIKKLNGAESYFESETLSAADRFNEYLMTGLRTSSGVDLNELFNYKQPSDEFHRLLEEFRAKNWLVSDSPRIYLTQEGKLRADFIASALFELN